MGNEIEGPVMLSIRNRGKSKAMSYGACEIQGWRKTMEDATIAQLNFEENASIFGICDGHGGPIISQFVAANFLSLLTNLNTYKEGKIEDALIETYLIFDSMLRTEKINVFLIDYHQKKLNQKELLKCSFTSQPESVSSSVLFTPSNSASESYCFYKGLIKSNSNSLSSHLNYNPQDKLIKVASSVSSENVHTDSSTASNSINLSNNNIDEQLIDLKEFISPSSNHNTSQSKLYFSHSHNNRALIANQMGTTANVLLIKNNCLYLSNVGDSLSVMYKNGKAIRLNREHNLNLKSEYKRVLKSNATVLKKRIEGRLNLSRAIGDLEFKRNSKLKFYEKAVIALPEITKIELTNDIEFIVMACDGVWNSIEPQKLCDMISQRIKTKHSIDFIIEEVFKKIIPKSKKNSTGKDNMSCVIIQFM